MSCSMLSRYAATCKGRLLDTKGEGGDWLDSHARMCGIEVFTLTLTLTVSLTCSFMSSGVAPVSAM